MSKHKGSGAQREAARRRAAAARSTTAEYTEDEHWDWARNMAKRHELQAGCTGLTPEGRMDRLTQIADRLAVLQLERTALLDERDELVQAVRADGVTWAQLVRRLGVTRQALAKRS